MSTFNVSTATFQQLKTQRLRIQTEREILLNEMMKGTIVRWEDIFKVWGSDIIDCRNAILAYPSKFAGRLTREEIEQMRQGLRDLLRRAARRELGNVQRQNKKVTKYTQNDADVVDDDKANNRMSYKSLNKPVK